MKQCYFCTNNQKEVDYKDVETLKQFLDTHSRIVKGRRAGLCARHQRKMDQAVKRARFLALIPFTQG